MPSDADPQRADPDGADDRRADPGVPLAEHEARLAEHADALAAAIEAALPGWIERLVLERVRAWSGHVSASIAAEALVAGEAARDDVVPRVRVLLAADIDAQRAGPLELLRGATGHAAAVLAAHEVPAMPRDRFSEEAFPEDRYGLVPATWADIDPDLHEAGITWGAAKAFVHKARRRAEGFA